MLNTILVVNKKVTYGCICAHGKWLVIVNKSYVHENSFIIGQRFVRLKRRKISHGSYLLDIKASAALVHSALDPIWFDFEQIVTDGTSDCTVKEHIIIAWLGNSEGKVLLVLVRVTTETRQSVCESWFTHFSHNLPTSPPVTATNNT